METPFIRTQMLIGEQKLNKLMASHVAVFGVGGVGGFTAEALVRSGVGSITIFDGDVISVSNINRQIIADFSTVGKSKVRVIEKRLKSINPDLNFTGNDIFITPENLSGFDLTGYDYIVDAIDTVSSKLALVERAKFLGVPIISCMGTGGKSDINRLKVADIKKTSGCPLARVMRREVKARGIDSLKVVYSDETANFGSREFSEVKTDGKKAPPSTIFVPATAGLMLAGEVVKDLTQD